MKKYLVWITILFILVGIIFWRLKSDPSQAKKEEVKSQTKMKVEGFVVKSVSLNEKITTTGTCIAFEEVELKSEINGKITQLLFTDGQYVQKGQLLVRLFDEDLYAQIKKVEIQKRTLLKTLERQSELLKIKGISQQEVDITQSQIDGLDAELAIIKVQLSKTQILAPFSGKTGLRAVSVGAVISPSVVMTTLQQTQPLKIDFSIPEKYSNSLKIGGAIEFRSENEPTKILLGQISAMDSKIDPLTRNLKIRAIFTNSQAHLKPGGYVEIFYSPSSKNVLLIPSESIIPQTRGKRVVISKNGVAQFREIETGFRTEESVEVLTGLQEKDTIITKGLMFVKPNTTLEFTKIMN